jgi:uncharacterized membrane protein required for colicin V production
VGPIEALFVTIQVIIAIVGVVRGYAKELGNTLVFMAAIFFLSYVVGRAEDTLSSFIERLFGYPPNSPESDSLLFFLYVGTFLVIVFASYAGRTLDFGGKPLRPPEGTILSLLVGLLNGYLVAGTIWYYADMYGYPFMNVNTAAFSETATFMLAYLPQNVVTNPVAWMVPVALLILLRVRG